MSPRRNRPRQPRRDPPAELDPERVRRGVDAVETWGQDRWRVRQIPGGAAVKTYRCPGCEQEVWPGVPHLVVWPADGTVGFDRSGGEAAHRRHWHTGCWRARDRRRPTR
jgi:hypothetical protein